MESKPQPLTTTRRGSTLTAAVGLSSCAASGASPAEGKLSPAQEKLRLLWEEHVKYEFETHDTEDTLATMVAAHVNHILVLTAFVGLFGLRNR